MTKDYAKITFDGSWLICEIQDVDSMTTDLVKGEYTVEIVSLSPQQFEALPEFEGW